jgi:hypothetical protein
MFGTTPVAALGNLNYVGGIMSAQNLSPEVVDQILKDHGARINRCAEVEQLMFDAARGKRPMPTKEELRSWANKLGMPKK